MGFYFSKSKFVAACTRCNKYAWLDKYKPSEKASVNEFTQSLFDNGHKVGELAKEFFNVDIDVTSFDKNGKLNLSDMISQTQKHIKLGTKVIAEASFDFGGFFCSVDILVRNDDGSYDIFEVKSSKREKITKSKPLGVKEKYILDAAYQQYVLKNCHINVNNVFIVLLEKDYVRGKELVLDEYFAICNVTQYTDARQAFVADKLSDFGAVLSDTNEPATVICKSCNKCDYWNYCGRDITSPSAFDIYDLKFEIKCDFYNSGVSFYDVPKHKEDLKSAALRQIEYYDYPNDAYINKTDIKEFLDSLTFPVYSLDFETYQAVVPEYDGIATYEQVPFQYSLHIVENFDCDIADVKECHFLDLSGADTRRAIAESLVKNIPYGACVVAYHESTERNIVDRLAKHCPDLADHLLSFVYKDPLKLFENGSYYVKAMGKCFSLKSVSPALYPDDKDMDYHNLEGDVKNGTQAMNIYLKSQDYTEEEKKRIENDLEKYCALDTLAVVKILKKLNEVSRE